MSIYLVLEFENEEEAKTLAKDFFSNPSASILTPVQENSVSPKIIGAFKKPPETCKCAQIGVKNFGYTFGNIYGWWVCSSCRRPTKQYAALMPNMGINLIPQKLRPDEVFVNPIQKLRSKYEWEFLLNGERSNSD